MSKYTTGEIAKLCGVSVRTVQYYDSRGVLLPSELSEGGRRLYSEDDLKRMRIICFLREAGLPINSISELFAEEHPEKIISILLDQQEQILREELAEGQKKLSIIESIKREVKEIENFTVEIISVTWKLLSVSFIIAFIAIPFAILFSKMATKDKYIEFVDKITSCGERIEYIDDENVKIRL